MLHLFTLHIRVERGMKLASELTYFIMGLSGDAGTMLMLKVTEILLDQRSRRIVTDYRLSLLERLFYTWVEL